ncbi:MAG: hypothetical protein L0177_01305 [Chloroflexi bacterium]|nr:hypothetical protein [Chloroflexota bacterium]
MSTTVAVIGYPGAGKTHFLAQLLLHVYRTASISRNGLDVKTQARAGSYGDLRTLALNLAKGMPIGQTPHDRLLLDELQMTLPSFGGRLRVGRNEVKLPLIDTGGELLRTAMSVLKVNPDGSVNYEDAAKEIVSRLQLVDMDDDKTIALVRSLHETLFRADAFIFLLDLVREVNAPEGDAYYTAFLQNLMAFRDARGLKRPKDVAIVFTKHDEARDDLAAKFEYEPSVSDLAGYFAMFLSQECRSRIGKAPAFFISYCEWQVQPNIEEGEFGKFAIIMDKESKMRLPMYPIDTYDSILRWISGL